MATREELEERLANATSPATAAGCRTKLSALGDMDAEPEAADAGEDIDPADVDPFDPDSPLTATEQNADNEAEATRADEE